MQASAATDIFDPRKGDGARPDPGARPGIAWGAAGWHICFDVLERLLAGEPMGRIFGAEAMKFGGWQRLTAEYAKQFGFETPGRPPMPRSVEACGLAATTGVLWRLSYFSWRLLRATLASA